MAAIIGSNAFAVGKVRGHFLSFSTRTSSCLGRSNGISRWRFRENIYGSFHLAAPRYTLYTRNDISMYTRASRREKKEEVEKEEEERLHGSAARKSGPVVPHVREGGRKGAIRVCLYIAVTVNGRGTREEKRPRVSSARLVSARECERRRYSAVSVPVGASGSVRAYYYWICPQSVRFGAGVCPSRTVLRRVPACVHVCVCVCSCRAPVSRPRS